MAKNKRAAEEAPFAEVNGVHVSRQKRIKYSEDDAKLAGIYNDLADEVQQVRIKAAGELLKTLTSKSSDSDQRILDTESRLIKGLCSGRKAARLGFSIALAEVLRLKFKGEEAGFEQSLSRIDSLTTVHGNVSGQEKRDHGLGRRFAFQAVLQSDIALSKRFTDREWQSFVEAIFRLASQKQWLRRECGAMLYEYLTSPSGSKLNDTRVQILVDELVRSRLAQTPEGVGIWITVQQKFPQAKTPKDVWHHRDPLSSKERDSLIRILTETTKDDDEPATKSGSRQATPSFAWTVVLNQLFQAEDIKPFTKFWDSAAKVMLSEKSSLERKALGLQIVSRIVSTAPSRMLSAVFEAPHVLQYILDQRSNGEKVLFDAAKDPLVKAMTRAKSDPGVAGPFVKAFVDSGVPNFDQLSKTKTMESLVAEADGPALDVAIDTITTKFFRPGVTDVNDVQNHRRALTDLLLNIVRVRARGGSLFDNKISNGASPSVYDSMVKIVSTLLWMGYGTTKSQDDPAITEQTGAMVRSRLMSVLGAFVDQPLAKSIFMYQEVFAGLKDYSPHDCSDEDRAFVEAARDLARDVHVKDGNDTTNQAFKLLFCLSIMQVYNKEPDGMAVLRDLVECFESRGQDDSPTLLVELLLSFVSKPSALFRKLAEQVFTAFAPQLTAEGLQSMIDILGQKESLSGQRELFDDNADGIEDEEAEDEDEDDEDNEVIDVEEESDVEIENGYEVEKPEHSDSASSSDASEETSSSIDDEEAAFDKKLAEALGTSGMDADSDSDGSDMDDDQMMALEPHLTSIFKERQKVTTKKQDQKDAKENIVNFKNRVLDLLMIYVKSQHDNVLALDLILPLIDVVRTTGSKPTAEKAFGVLKQYFEACNKNKVLPAPEDVEACFGVLEAVLDETKLEGSKLHGNACSRSALFLCKVLVALDRKLYERVAGMYAKLQTEWYLDAKSKIQSSIFTEWTSWSVTTRKHA